MSAKSAIGIETINGEIQAIYCRSDGHIKHNGAILENFYIKTHKIKDLMRHGDLNILRNEICPFMSHLNPPDSLMCEANNWCEFYFNGRKEPRIFSSRDSLINYFSKAEVNLIYIFSEKLKEWCFFNLNSNEEWISLAEILNNCTSEDLDFGYNLIEQ